MQAHQEQPAAETGTFADAKRMLMQKYGMNAEQASQAILAGLAKLKQDMGQAGANLSLEGIERMDQDAVYALRDQAKGLRDKALEKKKKGQDAVERAPKRNKFI